MIEGIHSIGVLHIGISGAGGCWHRVGGPWLYWTPADRYDAEPLVVLAEIVTFRLHRGIEKLMDAINRDHDALVAEAAAYARELVETAGEVLTKVQRAIGTAPNREEATVLAKANAELSNAIVAAYSATIDLDVLTTREREVGK